MNDVDRLAAITARLREAPVTTTHPGELREQLESVTKLGLIRRCAALRPGAITDITAAAKHTLCAIARGAGSPSTPRERLTSRS